MKKNIKYIHQSELARRLGVSPNTINKGTKTGRFKVYIIDGKKMFDYQDCKRVYIETKTRGGTPKKTAVKKLAKKVAKKVNGKKPDVSDVYSSEVLPPGTGAPHDLHDARLKFEKYKALKEQLNFEVMQKKYIKTEDVTKLLERLAQELKKAILAIPDRVGPIIAGETDPHKVRQIMIVEFKHSLQSITDTNTLEEKLKQ